MVCCTEPPLRYFSAISHRVSREVVVCWAEVLAAGALLAGALKRGAAALATGAGWSNLAGSSNTL
ncbi:hypothetical protein [Pseudomonas sp. 22 E 5]|nr:hypothetical protein [Pseudomonas sp. 31 E 6]CRM88766.1 hypothetical protein [Pseudomonas sp. 22 E 5]